MKEQAGVHMPCIVLARPGLMRNALQAFLRDIPELRVAAMAATCAEARSAIRQFQARLLVADMDVSETEVLALVRQLAAEQPALRVIVLAESIAQQQAALQAGAHDAALKGFLGAPLRDALIRGMRDSESATTNKE